MSLSRDRVSPVSETPGQNSCLAIRQSSNETLQIDFAGERTYEKNIFDYNIIIYYNNILKAGEKTSFSFISPSINLCLSVQVLYSIYMYVCCMYVCVHACVYSVHVDACIGGVCIYMCI